MAGPGILGKMISAARRSKLQKSGGVSAGRCPDDQAQAQSQVQAQAQAAERPVEGLRLAEALLVLEESYTGAGTREYLDPTWAQTWTKPSVGSLSQQLEPVADESLLINGTEAGIACIAQTDAQEAQLLNQDYLVDLRQGGEWDVRRSDPLPRLGHVADQVLCEDDAAAAKSISGPLLSSGLPLALNPQKQKSKSGPVLEAQNSGRYSQGRLWKKETEQLQQPDSRKVATSSGGAAMTSGAFAADPETLALWQAVPEDSAQVALSPPRRECWNNVYHHTQSVGNLAFSPASENDSLRSQCSAEEVSSSQRPIEEAEEEQRHSEAAAEAATGPAMPLASDSPVVKQRQAQSRFREENQVESSLQSLPSRPRARNLAFSGPLCFQGATVAKMVPSERLGVSMPLPAGLSSDALGSQPHLVRKQLQGFGDHGEWAQADASGGDGMIWQGEEEAREEVGEWEGQSMRTSEQECQDYRMWHERQNQMREGLWRPETGRCARTQSEELKGIEEDDRPEGEFLSGPLVQQVAVQGWCTPQGLSRAQAEAEEQGMVVSNLMPLEKSESGTRNGGRFAKYSEMDMDWEREDCLWDNGQMSSANQHKGAGLEGQRVVGVELGTGGRFASGAYDPVY